MVTDVTQTIQSDMNSNDSPETRINLEKIPRFSVKRKESVYVNFEKVERNEQNSGAFGLCQAAYSSYDDQGNAVSITTSGAKSGIPRQRGRKVYAAKLRESNEAFEERVRGYHQNYLKFNLASKALPQFYDKEVDGLSIRHATIHTFFAEGMDLFDDMQYHKYTSSFNEKLNLIKEVAAPLATRFHATKMAHRDLKPANIIVNQKTRKTTLIDLDKIENFDSVKGTFSGTAGYIPLVLNEEYEYQDLFALGVIGTEILLNGLQPHGGLNEAFMTDYVRAFNQFFAEEFSQAFSPDEKSRIKLILNTEHQKTQNDEQFQDINEIFRNQAFGLLTQQQAITQAQTSFQAKWKEAGYADNQAIFSAAMCFFIKQADKHKVCFYSYNNKFYHVSAFTNFALIELDKLSIDDDFKAEVPDHENVIDTLMRAQLNDPLLAKDAAEFLTVFQQASEHASSLVQKSVLNSDSDDDEEFDGTFGYLVKKAKPKIKPEDDNGYVRLAKALNAQFTSAKPESDNTVYRIKNELIFPKSVPTLILYPEITAIKSAPDNPCKKTPIEVINEQHKHRDRGEALLVGGVAGGLVIVTTLAAASMGFFVGAAAIAGIGFLLTILIARKLGKSTGRKEGQLINTQGIIASSLNRKTHVFQGQSVRFDFSHGNRKTLPAVKTKQKNKTDAVQLKWASLR